MRSDMAKVVTERPRYNSSAPSAKTGARIWGKAAPRHDDDDYDSGRTWRKASRLGQCRKDRAMVGGDCHKTFSDVLGPLRRYLRKQVGRRWDDVYSELSAVLDKRSMTGRHIWTHVRQDVTLDCYVGVSGRIWRGPYGVSEVDGLYVHPVSGVVCWTPERRFRYTPRVDPNVIKLDDWTELRRVDGLWFELAFAKVDRWVPEVVALHRRTPGHFEEDRVQVGKRQLNRKELRARGLRNENNGGNRSRREIASMNRSQQ